jgi:hypothetical protein
LDLIASLNATPCSRQLISALSASDSNSGVMVLRSIRTYQFAAAYQEAIIMTVIIYSYFSQLG